MIKLFNDLLIGNDRNEIAEVNSKISHNEREQSKFNFEIAKKCSEQERAQQDMKHQNEILMDRTSDMRHEMAATSYKLERVQSDALDLRRAQDSTKSKLKHFQKDQTDFNRTISEQGALLAERHKNFSEQQQLFNNDMKSQTANLQDKLGRTVTELQVMNCRANNLSTEVKRMDDRVENFRTEQNKFNQTLAVEGALLDERQKNFSQRQLSINDDLKSQTANLQEKQGRTATELQVMNCRANNLSTDVKRIDDRVENFQTEQNKFNQALAIEGALFDDRQRMLSQQQESFKSDMSSKTNDLQGKMSEAYTNLELVSSRADYMSADVKKIDGRVEKFQYEQAIFNKAIAERGVRVETRHDMFHKQQLSINSDVNSRTIALQDKLCNNSAKLELVNSRADLLQHGQNELSLNLRQVDQKVEQQHSEQNKLYQAVSERVIHNEAVQSSLMEAQSSFNSQLMNRTDSLNEKLGAAATKLEVVNTRADFLRDGQEKIDSTLKLERQIAEERQREQVRYNQMIAERNTRMECFVTVQKMLNDQNINRTEKFRDKLSDTSNKVDIINFSVDNVQFSQQRVEFDLGEMSKKVELMDHCTKELRAEQKQTNDLLKTLTTQMAEVLAKTKLFESRLEALQLENQKIHEKCITCEATLKMYEKSQGEMKKEIKSLNTKTFPRL